VLDKVREFLIAEKRSDSDLSLISTRTEGKDCEHFFPRYRYGIAIARHQTEWIKFFEQSFEIFLEANIELVAGMYFKLFVDLNQELPKFEAQIRDWLGLDEEIRQTRIISPTWTAILKQAERKIAGRPIAQRTNLKSE
jgi:hypothetical protein